MKMLLRRSFLGGSVAAFAMAAAAGLAPARAEYPEKPIEFIIPFGAGGGADVEGRLLAAEMEKILGGQIVPVNKPGGGGAITYTHVKNAKPDGYTIAWNSTSILTTTNIGNVPFKHDALDHIGQVEFQPMVFAVRADAPWQDLKAFASECKANADTLKIANAGTGSTTHLGAIALANATGCKVIHLPVGIKRRNASVLSGEAHAMVAPLTGAVKLNKAGKIRILAVLDGERNEVVADAPTAKEQGFDAQLVLFRGLSVPKGTPDAVKAKLTDAMVKAANSAGFRDFAAKNGFTVRPLVGKDFDNMMVRTDEHVVGIMKSAGLYQSKAN